MRGQPTTIGNFFLIVFLLAFSKNVYGQGLNSVVISEIFADPTPSHGLPEAEYIELYNTTAESISLEGFRLFYANSEVKFPAFELKPNAYVIVCRYNNAELFKPYGDVIGLSKFSLLNSGTNLILKNSIEELIFSLSYSDSWYTAERDQGYSLEMIDVNLACKGKGNWTSSLSDSGGTPGKENSTFVLNPLLTALNLLEYKTNDNQHFTFSFSENLSLNNDEQKISIEPNLELLSFFVNTDKPNEIDLTFREPLPENEIYVLSFQLVDCAGAVSDLIELQIGNARKPKKGEVLLSEILFNPLGSGSDFIEIYNSSNDPLNLYGLSVSNGSFSGNAYTLVSSNFIIQPQAVICFTENKDEIRNTYPKAITENIIQVDKLPTFPNEMGSVLIQTADGTLLDEFVYNEKMHASEIDNADGISLERLSFIASSNDFNKWASASSSENYATPGYVYRNSEDNGFAIEVKPQIFTPNGDGLEDEVEIQFLCPEGALLTASIFDVNGLLVSKLSNNQYIRNVYSYTWNGTFMSNGEPATSGYYITYAQFQLHDRIVEKVAKIVLVYP